MIDAATTPGPVEHRLFRVCIILKVVFWAALMAMLLKGIWATATGRELADPGTLGWVAAALGAAQLGAWAAWWLARRARRKGMR